MQLAEGRRVKLAIAAVLLAVAVGITVWRSSAGRTSGVDDAILKRAEQIRSETNDFAPPETVNTPPPPPPPKTGEKAHRGPRSPSGGG